jgi:hypothetical protein
MPSNWANDRHGPAQGACAQQLWPRRARLLVRGIHCLARLAAVELLPPLHAELGAAELPHGVPATRGSVR